MILLAPFTTLWKSYAEKNTRVTGASRNPGRCRHLGRIDFIVDSEGKPWLLEANTMPGFTSHSLTPKAAGQAGIAFGDLCDSLVRLATA